MSAEIGFKPNIPQELDSNATTYGIIFSEKNLTHTTFAKRLQQTVRPEVLKWDYLREEIEDSLGQVENVAIHYGCVVHLKLLRGWIDFPTQMCFDTLPLTFNHSLA